MYATRSKGKVDMVLYEPVRKPRTKKTTVTFQLSKKEKEKEEKKVVKETPVRTLAPAAVESKSTSQVQDKQQPDFAAFFQSRNLPCLSNELINQVRNFFEQKPKNYKIKDTPEFNMIKLKYFGSNERPKIELNNSEPQYNNELSSLINDYENIVQLVCYKRNRTDQTRNVLSSLVALLRLLITDCDAIILSNMNEAKFKNKSAVMELSQTDFLIAKQ